MINFDELNIHLKIRQIRECKNLTRKQVADKLNIETRTYSYIETGENNLNIKRLIEICNVFEITIEELLNFKLPIHSKDVKNVYQKE
jgi:transcriptional regulator with XRE-family HTH domain